MKRTNSKVLDNTDSVTFRLKQIQENGKVYITFDTILVSCQSIFKRLFLYDELYSIDSAIKYLKMQDYNEDSCKICLFNDFQECFKKAQEIQKQIQILRNFGKTFVYEDHLLFNLNKEDKNISISLETLISIYRTNFDVYFTNNWNQPEYPPFLTTSNLLYFGSLLQMKNRQKIEEILKKMFPGLRPEIFENAYEEAINDKYIIDPIKSSIRMFSIIYTELSIFLKYPKPSYSCLNHEIFDNKFIDMQYELFQYFNDHNFLVIKVNTPIDTLNALKIIVLLLYNSDRYQFFFENFFCYEDSDINSYFLNFENDKYYLKVKYSFIIHPEFLSTSNQHRLKYKLLSRMKQSPDMSLQKYVIITSSSDFIFGKPPNDLNDQIFTFGETSMNVDSNIIRNYCLKWYNMCLDFHITQSTKSDIENSIFNNKELNKDCEILVSHQFIDNENQCIPFELFNMSNPEIKNIVYYHFPDGKIGKGIKFWSYLYQMIFSDIILPANGDPIITNYLLNNNIILEIPQIQKESQMPLNCSNEKTIFSLQIGEFFNDMLIKTDEAKRKIDDIVIDKSSVEFIMRGIQNVLDRLKKKSNYQINSLKEYIELMYRQYFNIEKESPSFDISLIKLKHIEKYFNKYTKQYINYISDLDIEIDQNHFTAFFYLLTISSFFIYDCLPKEQKSFLSCGLTFFTINDLFNDQIKKNKKKFHFFTTKSHDDLFSLLDNFDFPIQEQYFSICYDYNGQIHLPQDVLRNVFCSSTEYFKIIQQLKKTNPQSYISRMQITMPVLFRLSVILNRIFLSQPIILSGDTGCGKTSLIMLLFEYFKLPINSEMDSLNIEIGNTLNCNGETTKYDVIEHLKKAPKSTKKHVIFFDKLNTSPSCSYIEHIFLNEKYINQCKFVFIGALNPLKKKNPITSELTKIEQPLDVYKKINSENALLNTNEKTVNNLSNLIYHVYPSQDATKEIIFDFNPMHFKEEEDTFYPEEERIQNHLIIEHMTKHPNGSQRKNELRKFEESIDICIVYIRKIMNERALVSYRDIERAIIILNELYDYCDNSESDEKEYSNLQLITIFISFVMKLPYEQQINENDLNKDEQKCSQIFKSVFEEYFGKYGDDYGTYKNGKFEIKIRDKLLSLLGDVDEIKKKIMTFIYQYTFGYLKNIDILKFETTFIHIFIMDICIRCKLPCFIIGLPGTSKSYPIKLIKEQYGEKLFVSNYLASKMAPIDGIKSAYYDAAFNEINNKINDINDRYSAVFINKIGNIDSNPSHPLNFLHEILDHGFLLNENGYRFKTATIGVSNNLMDFASLNRGFTVYSSLPVSPYKLKSVNSSLLTLYLLTIFHKNSMIFNWPIL